MLTGSEMKYHMAVRIGYEPGYEQLLESFDWSNSAIIDVLCSIEFLF